LRIFALSGEKSRCPQRQSAIAPFRLEAKQIKLKENLPVFTEFMLLLAERTGLVTVVRESDTARRANVIPKKLKEDESAAPACWQAGP